MKNQKTQSVSWLTPEERSQGEALQLEYDRLYSQAYSLSTEGLINQRKRAQADYLQDPNKDNCAALKTAEIEYGMNLSLPRDVCRQAVKTFVKARIYPWATSITKRGLVLAKNALDDVVTRERQRHMELTGQPMQKSDIVDAANVPVHRLEDINRQISSEGMQAPKSFFAAFSNVVLS